MMMKKSKITVAVLAAMLIFCGCGAEGKSSGDGTAADSVSEKAVDISAEELVSGISSENLDGRLHKGEDKYDKNAAKFYETDSGSIIDGAILYNENGGFADEVSAVKFADGTDGQGLLKKRLDSRTATFRDYRPEEVGKLESAKIFSAGGFDILIISDDADDIEKQIREKLS